MPRSDPTILMINYARSGGTLLTRMVGMLPGVVIVSEINPGKGIGTNGEVVDPCSALRQQMLEWYGVEIAAADFASAIAEITHWCRENARRFVFRDWPHFDFHASRLNGNSPANALTAMEALKAEPSAIAFAMVRDAIDAYASSGTALEVFAPEYLRYVEALIKAGVRLFRYEDLVNDPERFMRDLCVHCGLEYSEGWREYGSNFRCTGDIRLGQNSRGIRQAAIRPLPRKWLNKGARAKIDNCKPLMRANALLGYPQSYSGLNMESSGAMFVRKLRKRLGSLAN